LEKENLELMMEIKVLKERIIQLQAQAQAAATMGKTAGTAVAVAPLGPSSTSSSNAPMATSSSSITGPAADVPIKTATAPAVAPAAVTVVDKENGGVVVGEALLRARSDDETAPPFRSLNEDDTVNANSQCKQS
jgi:hypothetical protein